MNNAAFRALVEERRAPKSTKEIAREVVAAEFRNKKKKRQGRGGGGGDGYSSDSSNDDDEKEKKDSSRLKTITRESSSKNTTTTKTSSHQQQYRDRAKERREGRNVDYATTSTDEAALLQVHAQDPDMSKYLGGDEAHTHLVKGLDRVLARKVRREMGRHFASLAEQEESNWTTNIGGNKPAHDEETNQTSSASDHQQDELSFPETPQEALQFIRQQNNVVGAKSDAGPSSSFSSSLGQSMLDYLRYRFIPLNDDDDNYGPDIQLSSAGKTLQKSSLTFDLLHIDPHDKRHAWSIPEESIGTTTTSSNLHSTANLQVLNETLLHRIQTALENGNNSNNNKTKQQQQQRASSNNLAATDNNNKNLLPSTTTTSTKQHQDDSSSDDDIFADAGDDYVPAVSTKKEVSESAPTTTPPKDQEQPKKKSFFEMEDTATPREDDQSTGKPQEQQTTTSKLALPKIAASSAADVIDRDIFGGGGKQTSSSLSVEKRRTLGTGLATQNSDYGEDLDMDFDGSMEAQDDDNAKKKKKRKTDAYLTVGAMEYGKSWKRKLKNMSDE